MPDHEMWLAMHDDCPWPGCERCVMMDIEIDAHLMATFRLWTYFTGRPLDVLLYEAVEDGLKSLGLKA